MLIVEKWNHVTRRRIDAFGFIDLIGFRDCSGVTHVVMVQSTSKSNVSARVKKIANHENIGNVRDTNAAIEVHGWYKNKKGRWEVKVVDVS